VPQFVLEHYISGGRGGECNIVCTQPRRIAAVGVATRVAAEMGERVGGLVGYQIQMEAKVSNDTRLAFCTTGILLRRLLGDPQLEGVTHVLIDEVHERSVDTDFLLCLLKGAINRLY
jgi:HrpA-like RNA helicase